MEDSITWSWWKLADAEPLALFAYLRLRSDGRLIVTKASRGTGAGHLLVDEALRKAAAEYPGYGHRIQAQAYLERFYGSHGFEPEGEVYLEDGIPHIDMTLPLAAVR